MGQSVWTYPKARNQNIEQKQESPKEDEQWKKLRLSKRKVRFIPKQVRNTKLKVQSHFTTRRRQNPTIRYKTKKAWKSNFNEIYGPKVSNKTNI